MGHPVQQCQPFLSGIGYKIDLGIRLPCLIKNSFQSWPLARRGDTPLAAAATSMLHTRTMQIGVLERTGLTHMPYTYRSPRSVCGVPLPLRNYVYQNENEIRRLFPPSASLSLSLSPCRPLPAASERGCCAFRFSAFPGGSRRDQICSRTAR